MRSVIFTKKTNKVRQLSQLCARNIHAVNSSFLEHPAYVQCRQSSRCQRMSQYDNHNFGHSGFRPSVLLSTSYTVPALRCFCINKTWLYSVFEKTRASTQKHVKSHVFGFWKKKNVKRTYSLTGHVITRSLILNYRKSVGYWSVTNIKDLERNADARNCGDLEVWTQWSLSEIYELILTEWWLNFCWRLFATF